LALRRRVRFGQLPVGVSPSGPGGGSGCALDGMVATLRRAPLTASSRHLLAQLNPPKPARPSRATRVPLRLRCGRPEPPPRAGWTARHPPSGTESSAVRLGRGRSGVANRRRQPTRPLTTVPPARSRARNPAAPPIVYVTAPEVPRPYLATTIVNPEATRTPRPANRSPPSPRTYPSSRSPPPRPAALKRRPSRRRTPESAPNLGAGFSGRGR